MSKLRTHYDNLKVARKAPDAVIRAAYKALIQQYHPDKFEGPEHEALRITKIINQSFDVLIDPVKRAEHDRWIDEQEAKKGQYSETDNANDHGVYREDERREPSKTEEPREPKSWIDEIPNQKNDLSWKAIAANFLGLLLVAYITYPNPAGLKGPDAPLFLFFRLVTPSLIATVVTAIFYIFRRQKEKPLVKRSFTIATWFFLGMIVYGEYSMQKPTPKEVKWEELSSALPTGNPPANKYGHNQSATAKTIKRSIQINNACKAESISTSITYFDGTDWVTAGWWSVAPLSKVNTGLQTDNKEIYAYAISENHRWQDTTGNGFGRTITNQSFTYSSTKPMATTDSTLVRFFLTPAVETENQSGSYYEFSMLCSNNDSTTELEENEYLNTARELVAKYPVLGEDGPIANKVLAQVDVYMKDGMKAADALRKAVNNPKLSLKNKNTSRSDRNDNPDLSQVSNDKQLATKNSKEQRKQKYWDSHPECMANDVGWHTFLRCNGIGPGSWSEEQSNKGP